MSHVIELVEAIQLTVGACTEDHVLDNESLKFTGVTFTLSKIAIKNNEDEYQYYNTKMQINIRNVD